MEKTYAFMVNSYSFNWEEKGKKEQFSINGCLEEYNRHQYVIRLSLILFKIADELLMINFLLRLPTYPFREYGFIYLII